MTQQALADALGITRGRYAEIAAGKRGVTIDMALRLGRAFGTGPQLWVNVKAMFDLSEAQKSPAAAAINKLKPLSLEASTAAPAMTSGPSATSTSKTLRVSAFQTVAKKANLTKAVSGKRK